MEKEGVGGGGGGGGGGYRTWRREGSEGDGEESVCLSLWACLCVFESFCLCLSVCLDDCVFVSSCKNLTHLHLFIPPRWPSGKASASRAEHPGFESRLRRDFFGVESYQ